MYLIGIGILTKGIVDLPIRPATITTSADNINQITASADAEYNKILLNSDSLKYIISGVVVFLCNIIMHYCSYVKNTIPEYPKPINRRRILPQPREKPIKQAPIIMHNLTAPINTIVPTRPLTWVERTYIENRAKTSMNNREIV